MPRQGGGKLEQECVSACHRQRASRGDDGIELTVAQFDRRRATDSGAGPRHTLERSRQGEGRVIINPLFVSAGSLNVRFAPKATEVLRCRELTRRAQAVMSLPPSHMVDVD
jgi:hypothetical protein